MFGERRLPIVLICSIASFLGMQRLAPLCGRSACTHWLLARLAPMPCKGGVQIVWGRLIHVATTSLLAQTLKWRVPLRACKDDFSGWPVRLEFDEGVAILGDGEQAVLVQDFLRFSAYRHEGDRNDIVLKDTGGTILGAHAMRISSSVEIAEGSICEFGVRQFHVSSAGALIYWSVNGFGEFCGWFSQATDAFGRALAPPSKALQERYGKWHQFLCEMSLDKQLRRSTPYKRSRPSGPDGDAVDDLLPRILGEATLGTAALMAVLLRSALPRHKGGLPDQASRENCGSAFRAMPGCLRPRHLSRPRAHLGGVPRLARVGSSACAA